MKKTIFKPKVTVALQITAGQTLEAIEHEGKIFVEYPTPEISFSSGTASDDDEPATSSKKETSTLADARAAKKVADASPKKEEAKKSSGDWHVYTEEELMDTEEFPVTRLTKICKDRGIKIPAEGKNTNKKLRLLILEAQESASEEAEEEEEIDDAPTKKSESKGSGSKKSAKKDDDDDLETLTAIFEELDDNEIEEKDAVTRLVEFGYSKKDATAIVNDFIEDTDTPLDEFVAGLLGEGAEEEAEEEEEEDTPPARGSKKSGGKAKEELVEIADLEEGDKVRVFFKGENEFYAGEVVSVGRGGKVTVDFEDNSTDVLNAKENTKIYRSL